MPTIEEDVAVLKNIVETQDKTLDDHEERLRVVEEFKGIITTVKETVEKQGETVEKLNETVKLLNEEKVKVDTVVDLLKNIKPKNVFYAIVIIIFLMSSLFGVKLNTDTLDRAEGLIMQLESQEGTINAD